MDLHYGRHRGNISQGGLPSIREMFPEHSFSSSQPYTSAGMSRVARLPSSLSDNNLPHRSHSYSHHSKRSVDPMPSNGCHPSGNGLLIEPTCDARQASAQARPSHPLGSLIQAHGSSPNGAPTYAFTILRANPTASSLEHVRSSTSLRDLVSLPGATGHVTASLNTKSEKHGVDFSKAAPSFCIAPAASGSVVSAQRKRNYRMLIPVDGKEDETGEDACRTSRLYTGPITSPDTSIRRRSGSQYSPAHTPSLPTYTYTFDLASSVSGPKHQPEKMHTDGKRHLCQECKRRFSRPSSLKIHEMTHTGDKPFMCRWPTCGRRFNVNSNMRRHYRNHVASAKPIDLPFRDPYDGNRSDTRRRDWLKDEEDDNDESMDLERQSRGRHRSSSLSSSSLSSSPVSSSSSSTLVQPSTPARQSHRTSYVSPFDSRTEHLYPDSLTYASPTYRSSFPCLYTSSFLQSGHTRPYAADARYFSSSSRSLSPCSLSMGFGPISGSMQDSRTIVVEQDCISTEMKPAFEISSLRT